MKQIAAQLLIALAILVTSALTASCSNGFLASGTPEGQEDGRLYRPVNDLWAGHWSPDRRHAEDHLRAHNEKNGLSGGVVEYK